MCVGMVLSWQSALWISRLARRLSWPLFMTHWRGCWDIERCDVSAFGYAFIAAFIFAQFISVGGFFLAQEWGYVIAFLFFIGMMFWRPQGILGSK